MKKLWRFIRGGAALAVLVALVLGLVVLLQMTSGGGPAASPLAQAATPMPMETPAPPPQESAPAPATTTSGPYPPPGETVTPAPTEPPPPHITHQPGLTPSPTPIPSATRRPGPTATPFPIRGPAPDAAGTILYAPLEQPVIMGVPVDGQGRKAAEAAPLPLSLDFTPIVRQPSPDGRYLLLLQPVEPGGRPYVFDTQTQQLWPLFKGHPWQKTIQGWLYGWHPDSRQALFWFFNNEELWLADVETGQYTVLAMTEGPVQGAALSPDGQRIVYIGRSGANEIMWIVSAAGGDARQLFDPEGVSYLFGWSPDGAHILYAGGSSYSKADAAAGTPPPGGPLWLLDPQGQNRRPLSGHFLFGWGFEPVWSPDSQWVALTGPDPGRSFGCAQKDPPPDSTTCRYEGTAIYIENVGTGEVRRLAAGIEPTWSPDGTMLAFLSKQSGAPEVWVIRTDGTDLRQLTTDAQPKHQLVWAQTRR